ncbi:sister chromatid cohesion protein DCC1 [Durio zibethinus]|uniref:Sister chromatid cohesion protein DCC1 n=1 Tax=Durio zibethinus TaxID=66656 RepID=A0A6P5YWC2_DURZI|nr:sister chromatid cohesion protein DCC1 [Durio zibethinus]XP_022744435.1 sister chromatid cohesion protein DCC1 [Durio zibethinus]XP_022744436.1 sister chromatid cohesion protein DCC1 [Durio zibethinus]XP_022744437.1 sister chromatid cohesion protein DCC1 [Durio zibethinus]XP_022744438.1 sister chromatid cohesion protein DCC1 [Durio zibethinus]
MMEQPQPCCKGAQVMLNLQPTSSVSIQYHPLFGSHDDLILLELDEKLLPDVLYQRVTLRGQTDEDAVLCTKSKTYSVKFVGTSNSVLLVPPADYSTSCKNSRDCDGEDYEQQIGASVIKVAPGNMELVEVAPRLDKLKSILSENLYSSDEALEKADLDSMERSKRRLYTWDDLTNKVQASDDELRTGLQARSAVEIDGYWRIVDEKYMDLILRMLFHNSVLNDWSLDSLIEDKVVSVLESDGFPRKLAYHCLYVYGGRVEEAMDRGVWKMDARRVCVHFARGILREGKRKMESFMEEWMRMIPEEMQVSFDMLEGEVLTEKLGVETWVRVFSVSSLPSTPAERFSILFKERPKWEWKDLEPYIRDLNVPGLSSEALLLKYTRRTQPKVDAEPVFTAR